MRWFEQRPEGTDWIEISAGNETRNFVISADGNLLLVRHTNLLSNNASSSSSNQVSQQRAGNFRPRKLRVKCQANNSFGQHQMETELRLEPLPAHTRLLELEPSVEYINNSEQPVTVNFNCTIRASSLPVLAIEWLRNGKLLFSVALPQFAPTVQPGNGIDFLVNARLAGSASQSYINGSGILEEPSQELRSVEFYSPRLFDRPEGLVENDDPLDLQTLALGSEQQQQATGSYVVSSTSLLKLAQPEAEPRRLSQRVILNKLDSGLLVYQLQVRQVRRADRGSYQCRVRNMRTTQHATSHLMLKDNPPEFVETFPGQLLNPRHTASPSASLKCVASGSPLPEISWTLSGFPVPENGRFRVGDYVTRDGLIVSFVNITAVQPEGRYKKHSPGLI